MFPGGGQATSSAVPADLAAALVNMEARAGVVFAGHVLGVARNDAAGFVDIRFFVDEAVLGCRAGGIYVLREWAGLWTGQADRYRAGQRLLLLLTARGPSGMSSPVNGAEGMIPILPVASEPIADGAGNVPADPGAAAGISGMALDLRWVQTGVVRGVVSGVAGSGGATGSTGTFHGGGGGVHTNGTIAPPMPGDPLPGAPSPDPSPDPSPEPAPTPNAGTVGWVGPITPLPVQASVPGAAGQAPPSVGAVLLLLRSSAGVQVAR